MNTRRKMIQAKPDIPSCRWHLMNENFYPLFMADKREQVEYWYNMIAPGLQRDIFRRICSEIYRQDPAKPEPTFNAAYTETVELQQVHLILKNYTLVLSDDVGKPLTRVWLLHCGTSSRDRKDFRSVFTGCQTTYENRSVTHTDYVAPDADKYPTDRTHNVRRADWNNLNARSAMQELDEQRRSHGALAESNVRRRSTLLVEDQRRYNSDGTLKPRFTKPKSQFDGVNFLASLGFDGVPSEEALAQLKANRKAHREAETYYVDKDGSTVYKARAIKGTGLPHTAGRCEMGEGGILGSVTSEPITRWVDKTCF